MLYLDIIPESSTLPSMRQMILEIKSSKFSSISLIYFIDRTWNRMHYYEEFTCIFLFHLANKAELIIHNLLPYLCYYHSDKVLLYFTKKVKEEALEDGWDESQNRVIFATNVFLEEDL